MFRILIVDDEAPVRDLLASVLANHGNGYEVVGVASTGQEALGLTRELRPDVVITDIYMPGTNGLEYLQQAAREGIMPKAVIISGYDEFEYARQAMSLGVTDYLLKPFLPDELFPVLDRLREDLEKQRKLNQNLEELRGIADEQRVLLEEKLCRKLLQGDCIAPPDPDCQEARVFDFSAAWVMAVQTLAGFLPGGAAHQAQLISLLQEYFSDAIRVHGLSMNPMQTALIFTARQMSREEFQEAVITGLKRWQHGLKAHYDIQTRCALGLPRADWEQLKDSWEEAKAAWRVQAANVHLSVYGESGGTPDRDSAKQIRPMKSDIILDITLGKKREARQGIEALMKHYAAMTGKKSDYIFISVGELVYAVADELETRYGPLPESLWDQVAQLRQALEYSGLLELKERLMAFSDDCCDFVQEKGLMRGSRQLKEQVIALIEQEIANPDLDLEWVAKRLNFSPNYVRQSFRQQQNEAFSDYIIRRRMEKAGTMLRTTAVLVQDVAEACGYSNQRYFASSFKKYYGVTPTEYMKEKEKKNDPAD